jgi:Kef-type K+ transport system membrane component KefB
MNCLSTFWSWVLVIAAVPGFAILGVLGLMFLTGLEIVYNDWKKRR